MNVANNNPRAGQYIRQVTGYSAFIPKALPPNPPIQMDPELLTMLSAADRALGRLDGSTATLPNPDLFVFMYVRKEAVLSSQIEGTQASLMDVLEFEAQALEPGRPKDVEEVVNYVAAMNYGMEWLKNLPLSLRIIKEIHGVLLSKVRGGQKDPGEFRKHQNWIGPAGCTLAEASFVPPPPQELLRILGEFELFLHDETPMPPHIKFGLAHAQFETIHPFLDGNGRVGRLLITFLLCEKRILQKPLLYLSWFFKKHRTEYYERLQAVRDRGDWEGWLKFFLKGVEQVATEATQNAARIVTMREEHRRRIVEKMGDRSGNSLKLLERLYWGPIVTVKKVMEISGLTYANANHLTAGFLELGLLTELTGQRRNRKFAYSSYLAIVNEVAEKKTSASEHSKEIRK
jgi:Fic family protein